MPVPIFVLSYVLPNPGIKIFSKLLGFVSVNRTFNCTLKLRNKLLIISVFTPNNNSIQDDAKALNSKFS